MLIQPRSACADAFDLGPCEIAMGEISFFPPAQNFLPIQTYGTGWTHIGLCSKFLVCF